MQEIPLNPKHFCILAGVIIVVGMILLGTVLITTNATDSHNLKVCLASGKQWVNNNCVNATK